MGRTKAKVLARTKDYGISDLRCSKVKSPRLPEAKSLTVQLQNRANYFSQLAAVPGRSVA